MKKILFLLFAAAAFAACNDDDGEPKVRYATTNDGIENGYLQGANLHFYGTSTVTDAKGKTFTDPEAWFEFAGGPESFSLYMHALRGQHAGRGNAAPNGHLHPEGRQVAQLC